MCKWNERASVLNWRFTHTHTHIHIFLHKKKNREGKQIKIGNTVFIFDNFCIVSFVGNSQNIVTSKMFGFRFLPIIVNCLYYFAF